MKTSQLVSNFRTMYKLYSDDNKWTDRYLISTFNVARAKLLRDKSSKDKLKRTNWVGFCMKLCLAKPLECPCIAEAQCYALVSKYDIPDYISTKTIRGIDIRTASGEMLDEWSPRSASLSKHNPGLKNKKGYWLENYRGNTKLVIWNSLDLEYIYVSLLPTNLDDISEIPTCNSLTGEEYCIDWTEEEYPLDSDLIFDLYRLVDSLLNKQLLHVDDRTNDSADRLDK